MKSPGYVSAVTGVYARLLEEGRKPTAQERETLERAFSRSGFTDAYWRGTKGPEMLGFRPENAEAAPAVEAPRREEGRVPVRFTCRVEAGKPCLLTAEDPEGRAVTVSGPLPEAARNRALTPEDLAARLGKTGGTPYRCERADAYADPGLSLSAAAVNAYIPDTDAVIELGGEDAKIIFFGGALEERMNGSCAGGTGAFIDQMATLMNVTVNELDELSLKHEKIYPIASRCGVFAKSDIQPILNQGGRKEDVAASIFQAVVDQTVAGLTQGRELKGKIVFLGGPLHFLMGLR